jgi:hypothetical protein
VFTAGIGEHSAPVRAALCSELAWLGVKLDAQANASGGPRISTPDSGVSVWVIPTDEELMIAQCTLSEDAGRWRDEQPRHREGQKEHPLWTPMSIRLSLKRTTI